MCNFTAMACVQHSDQVWWLSDRYDGGEDNKCEGYFVPSETHREPCRAEAVNACLVDNLLTFYSIELKLYGNIRADQAHILPMQAHILAKFDDYPIII